MSTKGPETPAQARGFAQRLARYRAGGLCSMCAAAAAYAATRDHSRPGPCKACAPLVAAMPRAIADGWRGFDDLSASQDQSLVGTPGAAQNNIIRPEIASEGHAAPTSSTAGRSAR